MEENLPPGFRFHPTDEELINYYLAQKISDFGFASKAIADVDLNKCEPWDLPGKASMGEKEWYFFSLRDRKYPNGLRTNRATEAGYWKTTGKDKEIFRGGVLVGMKKTLVFYRGRAPRGEKTNWVMHEYRMETKVSCKPRKEEWVVCRVFQKSATVKKTLPTSPSQPSVGSPNDENMNVDEYTDVEPENLNSLSSSSIGVNNPSLQCYNRNINSVNMNMNMNTNWAREAAGLPSLSWPSSLLNPTLSTMNSLLAKALQFRSYQQREATSSGYSFMAQGLSQVDNDFSSNFIAPCNKVLGFVPPQPQHQQQQQQQQEQPFNLDSMW
ncbi:hypothetical protein Nepgr_017963 [Nepenthes gracilis]|uniref:NAC domain-containing protein n=1 Tax=Nepenthes gracilis TaxID=150966 RepID=A0AAD3XSN3_NEPGR|nr:hypothetical protein Nepgr_017963 [Nepenthes gracilis]